MKFELFQRLSVILRNEKIRVESFNGNCAEVIDCDICQCKVPAIDIEALTFYDDTTLLCRKCVRKLLLRLAAEGLKRS